MRGLLALGLGLLFAAGVAGGGDAKTDSAKLQGKWVGEVKGKGQLELTFAKDTFTLDFGGKFKVKGTVKLDPKKKPKEMDLTITEGGAPKSETALCIYELTGDTLKWCGSAPGNLVRAKEFPQNNDGGGQLMNVTFKRVK